MQDIAESIQYFRALSGSFLVGKVAIVNSADDVLGQAIAEGLAAAGARLVLGVRGDGGDRPGSVMVQGSPADPTVAAALVAAALDSFGRLNIIVNNPPLGDCATLDTFTASQLDTALDESVRGILTLVRFAAPELRRQGGGRIVNLTHALAKSGSARRGPHFSAAFAAISGLTKELTSELFPHGITVNAVAPGNIAGRIAEGGDVPPMHVPLGRLGTPEEVAASVLFLCSDHANFITGACIDVNGGSFMD